VTPLVRDATPDDVEAIARVHVQGWREAYAGQLSEEALAGLSVGERATMWRRAFERPDPRARFLIAERVPGGIVGFARGGPSRPGGAILIGTEAEIYAIYLLDVVKRLRGLFDHFRKSGFASAGLWVLDGNIPARSFYEALGGVPGPEQSIELQGERVREVAYRFEPIPAL
jgi:hypothetical protein